MIKEYTGKFFPFKKYTTITIVKPSKPYIKEGTLCLTKTAILEFKDSQSNEEVNEILWETWRTL